MNEYGSCDITTQLNFTRQTNTTNCFHFQVFCLSLHSCNAVLCTSTRLEVSVCACDKNIAHRFSGWLCLYVSVLWMKRQATHQLFPRNFQIGFDGFPWADFFFRCAWDNLFSQVYISILTHISIKHIININVSKSFFQVVSLYCVTAIVTKMCFCIKSNISINYLSILEEWL